MRLQHLCSISLLIALAACGGGPGTDQAGEQAESGAPAGDVTVADAATITGSVRFTGSAPQGEAIDMSDEPDCAAKHPGGARKTPVVANSNGTLRNVFVYVKEGLADGPHPSSSQPAVLDQNGCVYSPHVLGVRTGQELTIRNSDGLLHNINAQASANRGFNISQPTSMESRRSFSRPEIMIPVRCDVHGWMEAYLAVVDHPYFAVTGEDGSFEIGNLPPGTYTLEAWHERYGTQTSQVTVGPSGTGSVDFAYNAAMAATAVVPLAAPIYITHGSHTGHDGGDR